MGSPGPGANLHVRPALCFLNLSSMCPVVLGEEGGISSPLLYNKSCALVFHVIKPRMMSRIDCMRKRVVECNVDAILCLV